MFSQLPVEVIILICSFLNFKQRLVLSKVCKILRNVILDVRNTPKFLPLNKIHLYHDWRSTLGNFHPYHLDLWDKFTYTIVHYKVHIKFPNIYDLITTHSVRLQAMSLTSNYVKLLTNKNLKSLTIYNCENFDLLRFKENSFVNLDLLWLYECAFDNDCLIQIVNFYKPKELFLYRCYNDTYNYLDDICKINNRLESFVLIPYKLLIKQASFKRIVHCVEILNFRNQKCQLHFHHFRDTFIESRNQFENMINHLKCEIDVSPVSVCIKTK